MSEQKSYNPRELTPEELNMIPEPEKQALMQMPTEPDSLWDEKEGQWGKYMETPESIALGAFEHFYKLLIVEHEKGVSHLLFGGFRFNKGSGKVIKKISKTKPAGGGGGGGGARPEFKPKILEETFFGTFDEVNDKLADKSQNWTIAFPAVTYQDRFLIVRTR